VEPPSAVDGEHPVPVAVICEADVRAGGADQPDQALGMGRAAVRVDVASVRLGRGQHELRPERREDHRRSTVSGPVRAIQGDSHAGQIEGERRSQLADVVVEGALERPDAADPLTHGLVETRLDGSLRVVVELGPARIEELDPVVGERVVARRDDAGQVEAEPPGEHRSRRRGQNPSQHGVASTGGDPRRECLLQHRTGLTGVADDQDLGPLGFGL
jgi:hypothetical protein